MNEESAQSSEDKNSRERSKATNTMRTNLATLAIILMAGSCFAAEKVITPDLAKIATGDGWTVFNREAKISKDGDTVQVHFDGRPGAGGAWLETLDFAEGVIECDVKGKSRRPSFVGIAFHAQDAEHFEAVYFRAFNFRDEARRRNSVQYISHPDYAWWKLRQDSPGKYENAIDPAPDPEGFFHVKLVIEKPKVSIYVNQAKQPCLIVEPLSDRQAGKVGLWVDNESNGAFANLKIMPKQADGNGEIAYGSNEAVGRYVEVNGVKLYYEVYGQGEPLILLHGGVGSIDGFQQSIPTLARHYQVYAYDRSGHGRSYDSGKPFDYGAMADETVQFMDALNIPSASMVGYSDGGVIGYHIAARHPKRITRLIAVGANLRADVLNPPPAVFRQMLDPDAPAPWVRDLEPEYRRLSPKPDFSSYVARTRDLWTGHSYPSEELFKTISIPVLLVSGDRHDLPLEHVMEMYRALNNAQICIIPNCDHFVFGRRAALMNQIILEFLEGEV